MKKLFLLLLLMPALFVAAQTNDIQTDSDAPQEVVYTVVEHSPQFPGGQQALMSYLNKNMRYPTIAKENGIQGRAICRFVVEKDGSISNVEVFRSAGEVSLDKEAIRLISSMPQWTPGSQRGKPVRVQYTLPITFKLN